MSGLAKNQFDLEDDDLFQDDATGMGDDLDFDLDDDFELDEIDLDGFDDSLTEDLVGTSDLPPVEDAAEVDFAAETSAAEAPPLTGLAALASETEAEFDAEDSGETGVEEVTAESVLADSAALAAMAGVTGAVEGEDEAEPYADDAMENDHRPVPRINIHAFCETDRTCALMEKVANDRRLSKAHVNIFMGGVKKASRHYQQEVTPNLVILETSAGGQAFLDGLNRLAEVCDPSTNVIVTGGINDIRLYRELLERGIRDYIVNPRQPIHLIRAISEIYADPSAPPVGRNVVFVGARGGVGSSTLCHSVGWALSEELQSDSIILDFDLAFGTAGLDFEQDPSQGLTEALEAPERLDDVLLDRLLQKCTDRLSLFTAPNLLDRSYDLPADSYESVLEIVRKAAPNVLIDMPHVWTSWSMSIIQSADEIVLTTTPDLASFRNAKNIIEAIKDARANDAPPLLVINQAGVPKRPEIPVEQFVEALEIEPFAVINWDPVLFGNAATNAEALTVADDKSKAAEAVRQVAARLIGHEAGSSAKKSFDLMSIFRKG